MTQMDYGELISLLTDTRNTMAYIADIDTYELVFLTRAAMAALGMSSPEEYAGKKCYAVMQGQEAPCPFCANQRLLAGESPCFSERFHPGLKRWLRLEDRLFQLEGRRWRGQWATDITEDHAAISDLRRQMEMDRVAVRSIHTLAVEPDAHRAVNLFLQDLGGCYRADRTCIFEINEERGTVRNSYEWCAPGVPSQMERFQNAPLELVSGWVEHLKTNPDLRVFPEGGEGTGEMLSGREVHSLLLAPLRSGEDLAGFLGVDNPRLFGDDSSLLRLSADLVIAEFQKRQLMWDLGSMASTDRLTGLLTRAKYLQALEEYQKNPPASLAVLFLDLNGLKELNEQSGHDRGDWFICRCADILRSRKHNAYRVDGDEFVVLLPGITEDEARRQEAALRTALEDVKPYSVSLGCAFSQGEVDIYSLITEADDRMYAEKQTYYRAALTEDRSFFRTGMASDLLAEIKANRFVVYFQPQVNLQDGSLYGGEALVRKLDEDGSIIPPVRFIPYYEAEGVISHLDFHVLEQVCVLMDQWRTALGRIPNISVNFSRQTLMEPDVVAHIRDVCDRYSIPPSSLTIEVTESAGKLSRGQLHLLAEALQDQGFSVSLDDFGSQYSNLSILTGIDFQVIKLDKSLIDQVGVEERSTKVVRDLLHLCKDTIYTPSLAEGVETREQAELLRNFSCNYVQGYYFSRPIPAGEFTELIRSGKVFEV